MARKEPRPAATAMFNSGWSVQPAKMVGKGDAWRWDVNCSQARPMTKDRCVAFARAHRSFSNVEVVG